MPRAVPDGRLFDSGTDRRGDPYPTDDVQQVTSFVPINLAVIFSDGGPFNGYLVRISRQRAY
jgi:hypothetical protein